MRRNLLSTLVRSARSRIEATITPPSPSIAESRISARNCVPSLRRLSAPGIIATVRGGAADAARTAACSAGTKTATGWSALMTAMP